MAGTRIFVGYHKPYELLDGEYFTPLHLGRAVALAPTKDDHPVDPADVEWLMENTVGDDTGENMSERNRNYNELSGIYWAWKNYEQIGDPDRIGFMQYRRHFIFNERDFADFRSDNVDEVAYAKVNVGRVYDGYEERFGLTTEGIDAALDNYDVVVPLPCDLSHYVRSIAEDYTERIPGTHPKDLRLLKRAVDKIAPEYGPLLRERLHATDKRCYQSFVLSREQFFAYCEFLFGVLAEVDAHLDTSRYSLNGQRTIGYLGEILFDTYFSRLTQRDDVRWKELRMTYLGENTLPAPILPKTAIVVLAYADFESLELTLAAYGKWLHGDTKLFVLQNGRGTYDTERTYRVAKRYAALYPRNIEVVDDIPPQRPYTAIKALLESKRFSEFDYVCKVDDDAFPLTPDWFERLCELYDQQFAIHGDNLAYVSAMVNNNPFGFKHLIERVPALAEEYFDEVAIEHVAGWGFGDGHPSDNYPAWRIVPPTEIDDDVCGTIWRYPHVARWIHEKTTLHPDDYIALVKDWGIDEVGLKRYSINVMLFAKPFWNAIADPSSEFPEDDEFLSEQYCKKHGLKIVVDLSNPFVHLFFYTQREENKDLIPTLQAAYQEWLAPRYRIAMQPDKAYENENRLRFMETPSATKQHVQKPSVMYRAARRGWSVTPEPVRRPIRRVVRKVRGRG